MSTLLFGNLLIVHAEKGTIFARTTNHILHSIHLHTYVNRSIFTVEIAYYYRMKCSFLKYLIGYITHQM